MGLSDYFQIIPTLGYLDPFGAQLPNLWVACLQPGRAQRRLLGGLPVWRPFKGLNIGVRLLLPS